MTLAPQKTDKGLKLWDDKAMYSDQLLKYEFYGTGDWAWGVEVSLSEVIKERPRRHGYPILKSHTENLKHSYNWAQS